MHRILIVDDDRQFRSMLRRLLADKGYQVDECSDGELIESVLEKGETGLIFLDIIMERKSGLESLIEIRQKHPGIPVVLVSGTSSEMAEDLFKAAEYWGAAGCLQKPFSSEEIFQIIDSIMK